MTATFRAGEQATLERFAEPERCRAYTLEGQRRCQRDRLPGLGYCNQHLPLADVGVSLDG